MADSNNKVLTILDVKDLLGPVLIKDLHLLNQLDKSSNLDNLDKGFNKISRGGTLASVGRGMLGLAGIAGGALVTGLAAATNKAKAFETEFLQLKNLNLDKTDDQIKNLNSSILDAAYDAGRLPVEMTKAFYDVQSATGFFGADVDKIARKTSDFSRGFNVDFNTAIESAVKGIKNFNLSANDMDKFFASMIKTEQVGIITLNQLSKVQTDYAGAANAAGQSVDSANKLMAVFTANTKSAEEAATLTKSAFIDLTKKSTLDGFKNIGISVYDATGKVKQIDQIVGELNKKFKGLSDREIGKIVNKFGGNEGLAALLQQSAKNGDQMLATFQQFDSIEYNLDKALENSKMDLTTMSNIVGNKLNVLFTELGRVIIPDLVKGLDHIDKNVLPGMREQLPVIVDDMKTFMSFLGDTGSWFTKQWRNADKAFSGGYWEQKRNDESIKKNGLKVDGSKLTPVDKMLLGYSGETLLDKDLQVRPEGFKVLSKRAENYGGFQSEEGKRYFNQLKFFVDGSKKIDEAAAKAAEAEQNKMSTTNPKGDNKKSTASMGSGGGAGLRQGLRAVVGGDGGVRNVTVNIQKMIGVEQLVTTMVERKMRDIGKAMTEELVRSIRDAEVAISQSSY